MNKPSSEPLVSVIIVSWNAREYLLQCLASLTPAVCRYRMEIIVVDNASSDGSPEAAASRFPHVQVLRNGANLGFAKANNVGIAASSGQYVALVNSDVKVLPECINRLVEFCETHPEVGMVGPRVTGGDGNPQRSCKVFPSIGNVFCRAVALDTLVNRCRRLRSRFEARQSQDGARAVDVLSGCFWVVRREALEQVGCLDEAFFMYGEDVDWCKRFWEQGWQVLYVPSAEAIHYGGGSSANAPVRFYIERHRADLRYWRKHHSWPAVASFYVLSCFHLFLRASGYWLRAWMNPRRRKDLEVKVSRSTACLKWMVTGQVSLPPGERQRG